MSVRKTTQVGNSVIRIKAKSVKDFSDPEVKKIVRDLTDSMREHNLVGMAAPQIDKSLRVFVTEIRKTKLRKISETDDLRVFVNPKITHVSKKLSKGWEGCGSVAESGLFAIVSRPESVVIEAFDEKGSKFSLKTSGLLARIVQHEVDHLNGTVFTDKADLKTVMSRNEYLKLSSRKS